jgi:glutamate dehydrogenase
MKNNKKEKSTTQLIEKWSNNNRRSLDRWERILSMLHASDNVEYTMFFIAIRELLGLISTSETS